MKHFLALALLLGADLSAAATVDCSNAYGKAATCEVTACSAKYNSFIGTWSGPFMAYSQELSTSTNSVFRPYQNSVTYSTVDCLRNIDNGDTFIIGRKTDDYPAFSELAAKSVSGLLITGRRSDGSPFLKTMDSDGVNEYVLVYQNSAASLSIWGLTIPANGNNPEMRFTTIDGQDFSVVDTQKRNVTVTMSIGPVAAPVWEGVVATGFHSLVK